MGLLLSDIMKLDCLAKGKVIAAKQALDVEVQGVCLLNENFLTGNNNTVLQDSFSGGDLLFFASCSSVCSTQYLISLIKELSERKISGMFLQPVSSLFAFSSEVIEVAKKISFPLVQLHEEDNITIILDELLALLISESHFLMKKAYELNKKLTTLVLTEGEIGLIAQALADFSQAKVIVTDIFNENLAEARPTGINLPDNQTDFVSVKKEVILNNEANAFLTISKFGQPIDEFDLMAADSAVTNIAFYLLKELEAEEVEKSYRHEFLNDLVDGDIKTKEEIIQLGTYYGLNLTKSYVLLLLEIESMEDIFPKKSLRETYYLLRKTINFVLKSFFANSKEIIVWNRGNSLIIFYPVPEEYEDQNKESTNELKLFAKDVGEKIKKAVLESLANITMTMGIGRYYADIADINKSYKEARIALEAGKSTWGNDAIYHYNDLGAYRIISNYPDSTELHNYVNETLGALIGYDVKNNTKFLYTLEMLLNHHGNHAETASKLFIHPKTLAYRKNRIEDILGISLDNAENVFNLSMALKARRVMSTND